MASDPCFLKLSLETESCRPCLVADFYRYRNSCLFPEPGYIPDDIPCISFDCAFSYECFRLRVVGAD